jgi:type I restriction enzyme S subunit
MDRRQLPDGWKVKRLGEIAFINYGYTAKASSEKIGPKLLRITDIQNDKVDWSSVPYCPVDEADFQKYKLIDQDIVFARTGATTGKSYLVSNPPESVAASYLIRLRIKDSTISPQFISKFFQTSGYWKSVSSGISGSAQGGFNASKLSELVVKIPPIDEQKRIMAILDEAFEGIDQAIRNTEKNLANARELFDSYLNKIFTQKGDDWEEKTLGDVCIFQGGSQPSKAVFSPEKKEGYIRLIQIRDYKTDNHIVYIPKKDARRFCQPDDVMIGRYGPPLFQILRGLEGAYNVALMKAIPNELLVSKDFLFYFLKNKKLLNYIIHSSNRAAGQIGLNKATIEPYPIAFPSLNEQIKIVSDLKKLYSEVEYLETIYRQKLAALNELKQSILQKAFTGQLTK